MSSFKGEYEQSINSTRRRFFERKSLTTILDSRLEPELLHVFLMYFSAFGIGMTEPVESWIRRAGERCQDIGLLDLGLALVKHARQEAGHHRLMIDDVHILADHWNRRSGIRALAPDVLLSTSFPASVLAYRSLHERVIDGPVPFAQIAIEYEIEALSVRHGPALLSQCQRLLPGTASSGLSFLTEHVAIDVAHTQFNEQQLDRLLADRPDAVESLVEAGASALEAYGDFMDDCLAAANHFLSPAPDPVRREVTWRLEPPPGASLASWRDKLTAFRGKTLWNNGRRPQFLQSDGTLRDPEHLDEMAWHVLALADDEIVGCVRVLPLSRAERILADNFIGREVLEGALSRTGVSIGSVAEVSRWTVTASRGQKTVKTSSAKHTLGFALLAATVAVTRRLGGKAIIGSCGMRDSQDRLIVHAGGMPVPDVPLRREDQLDDVLILMMLETPTPHFERLIGDMDTLLADQGAWKQLPSYSRANSSGMA